MTNVEPQSSNGHGFLAGVIAGGILGTALTIYLAPRLSAERRLQITESARRLRRNAADHLGQVTSRIGDALDQASPTAPAEVSRDRTARG